MGTDLILIPTVNTKAEPSEMFEWEISDSGKIRESRPYTGLRRTEFYR